MNKINPKIEFKSNLSIDDDFQIDFFTDSSKFKQSEPVKEVDLKKQNTRQQRNNTNQKSLF